MWLAKGSKFVLKFPLDKSHFITGDVIDEKKNVIENFVEMKNDRSYGRPKELWSGHFTGDIISTKFEEYKVFFSSCYIKNRGAIMHEKLKERYK